jgi:hypothetical protein
VLQIIFGLVLLFLLLWLVEALTQSPPERRNKTLGYSALSLFCLLLLLLVVTGRLHILVAIGAAMLPLLKQLPRLLPYLMPLKDALTGSRGNTGNQETASRRSGALSREDACAILGLGPDPGEADIIDAHRRLIQKMHPDRGGSKYLAARINEARDVLLQSFK